MLSVIVENKYQQQLNLTTNDSYALIQVTGLTPPASTINTATTATKDGSVFNSSRMNNRNIVLTIVPLGNVEKSRINLYNYFKSKQYIKLYLENNTRSVWIDGYIESIEGDLYAEDAEKIQISIICNDPYFKDTETGVYMFSNVESGFSFPFSIAETPGVPISELSEYVEVNVYNASDYETGLVLTLTANGGVVNPTIYNMTTNENFSLNITMETGEIITIDTRPGSKSVKLNRNGTISNILNNMVIGSEWITLTVGDNVFSYTTDTGSEYLYVIANAQPIYEGI